MTHQLLKMQTIHNECVVLEPQHCLVSVQVMVHQGGSGRRDSELNGVAPHLPERGLLLWSRQLPDAVLLQQQAVLLLDLTGVLGRQVVDLEADALHRRLDGFREVRLTLTLEFK